MIWLELDSVWTKNFGNALFICVVIKFVWFPDYGELYLVNIVGP